MKAFQYATATTPESAQAMVSDQGLYLAGGNDLLGQLKEYLTEANLLVNIKSLPGLNKIAHGSRHWTIGSQVTVAQIENDPDLQKKFPGLHEAAAEVGSQQIRNVASVGGNLAQHSRAGITAIATPSASRNRVTFVLRAMVRTVITVCSPATLASVR